MRRVLALASFLLAVSASLAAAQAGGTLHASGTVEGEYRHYPSEDLVAYPQAYTRERVDGEVVEVPVYANVSEERFAALKGNDLALEALEKHLREELGEEKTRYVDVSITDHPDHRFALDVSYRAPVNGAGSLTAGEVREAAPANVTVDVSFSGMTETVTFPVQVSRAPTSTELGDAYMEKGAGATQSGGGGNKSWTLNVSTVGTACMSGNTTAGVDNVEYEFGQDRSTASFRGVIRTADPCQEIAAKHVELVGDTYTVNLVTNSTGGFCIQCVGALTYHAEFSAEHPAQVVVEHNGERVRTLELEGSRPAPAPGKPDEGLLEGFLDWLRGLL
ncbi:MAG: hypothetical protein ABEJ62_01385 [Candidatus Nanohaloarchaea archaeon]